MKSLPVATGLLVILVSARADASILTIDILPHTLKGARVLVDVKGDTIVDNHLVLSEKRAEMEWDIPVFDESLYGQLLSVGLEFSYENIDLNYHAGVNQSTPSSITGQLEVREVMRLTSFPVGNFLNDLVDSTDLPIGPFGAGIDPGFACQVVDHRCLYVQETKLSSAAAYFFDQSSGVLAAFTDAAFTDVFASLIFEMNLSWVTDSTDYRIASSIGRSEPLPPVALHLTYTYVDPAAVPEPSTLVLLGLGAFGFVLIRLGIGKPPQL